MKIQAKQYAEALLKSLEGKSESEIKPIIRNFTTVLVQNNNLSQAGKIIEEFSRLWNIKNEIIEAEVTLAHEQGPAVLREIEAYLKAKTGSTDVKVKQKVDKKILGGLVIKYRDRVLDGSLKTKLSGLKQTLVK